MAEKSFDPNAAAALGSGIYGLPCTAEEAEIIIIPVEWELTTSYNRGTVDGPSAVFDGSSILQRSAFFTVQLPHPYMTTGKTIALTRWTFVAK